MKHPLCEFHVNGKATGICYCEAEYVINDPNCQCCVYCCGGDDYPTEVRSPEYFAREFYDLVS